jgi:hypothetical protein
MRRAPFVVLSCFLLATVARGQERPLRTTEPDTVPAGTLRVEAGFDFLQGAKFPLSGLSGDLTSVGVLNLRMGVGKIVEVELEGTIQNFLTVKERGASFVPVLNLSGSCTAPEGGGPVAGSCSTHDFGDFALSTKIHILSESDRRPSFAMRVGFIMPNSDQAKGIGPNSTDVFALLILGKHFGKLEVFGNAGLDIMSARTALFTQNDALLYGGAFRYSVHRRVRLVGEVAGRYSTQKINANLIGTESQSQARIGFQILAGGFQWDVAGIRGLNDHNPSSGFTFGVTKDIHLFDYGHIH